MKETERQKAEKESWRDSDRDIGVVRETGKRQRESVRERACIDRACDTYTISGIICLVC